MTIAALSRRMDRIEARRDRSGLPAAAVILIVRSDEDRARQLAQHEAAGTYKASWPLLTIALGETAP